MQSLLDPAILFFVFGAAAGFVRSNLEIPPQISRFLSLYLMMALGLKGGFALAESGFTADVSKSLGVALLLAVVVPLAGYALLRRLVGGFDAAAVAATYGSVSAVTFITATHYMEVQGYDFGAHMPAALALMESPAIIMAVLFANILRRESSTGVAAGPAVPIGKVLHESFTDGAQLLLLGAMLIGLTTGDSGKAMMEPFTADLFKGLLSFFLLDMGLMAARNIGELRGKSPWLLAYGVGAPLVHVALALALCLLLGVPQGDAALLMVLAASASYIAVPAVLRFAIPEANPGLYFGLSLGVTFPLNIVFGIPLYVGIAYAVVPGG
jgi:hypothetical protein